MKIRLVIGIWFKNMISNKMSHGSDIGSKNVEKPRTKDKDNKRRFIKEHV